MNNFIVFRRARRYEVCAFYQLLKWLLLVSNAVIFIGLFTSFINKTLCTRLKGIKMAEKSENILWKLAAFDDKVAPLKVASRVGYIKHGQFWPCSLLLASLYLSKLFDMMTVLLDNCFTSLLIFWSLLCQHLERPESEEKSFLESYFVNSQWEKFSTKNGCVLANLA